MNFKSRLLSNPLPTPKTLDEAIEQAICIGPMCEIKERSYHVLKDFMAQKFCIALFEVAHDEKSQKAVRELFDKLTAREKK